VGRPPVGGDELDAVSGSWDMGTTLP